MKILNLYPDDFRNINDWYAICDQLGISYNALLIELECSKVMYEDATETNILTYLN
jgi:hypothetical protein